MMLNAAMLHNTMGQEGAESATEGSDPEVDQSRSELTVWERIRKEWEDLRTGSEWLGKVAIGEHLNLVVCDEVVPDVNEVVKDQVLHLIGIYLSLLIVWIINNKIVNDMIQ